MDSKSLLPLLRRWWRLLLVGAVVGGAAGYFVASRSAPTYESDVKMIVGPINTDYDTLRAAGELGRSYAELAVSKPVLAFAIKKTGARTTPTAMLKENAVRTTSNDITRIVQVTVQYGDPKTAADLANALASRVQRLAARSPDQFTSTARTLMEQPEIARLSRDDQDRVSAAAGRVLDVSVGGLVTIVDPAEVPDEAVAPRVKLITVMAAFMGLLAMALFLLVRESSAQSIADERSLVELDEPAYLGAIAAPLGRRGVRTPLAVEGGPSASVDAYRAVATKMGLFDRPPRVRSLLVLDTANGGRAGAAAANLAGVLADAGRKVLLLDANATGGGATAALNLEGRPGYGELLAGLRGGDLNGHLDEMKVAHADFEVLPRGVDAGEQMIDADRAQRLLDELTEDVDMVVISGAPIERSPAALVWSRVSDGVVLVVDDGRTSEDRVKDTLRSLRFSGANTLGTVLGRRGGGRARKPAKAAV
jgi:succinoglycan biosynthesis transport protein ExoP